MSEERVEAYAKLLNTLISAVRQEERALSRETEAERDALREQVRVLKDLLRESAAIEAEGMDDYYTEQHAEIIEDLRTRRCEALAATEQKG